MDDPILETRDPVAVTCPECGGALAEEKEGNLTRYACHVGHAFGTASLLSFQTEALERALWTAMRALEETACLRRSMAQRAATGGLQGLEDAYRRQAARAEGDAELIRGVLISEETLVGGAAADPRDCGERPSDERSRTGLVVPCVSRRGT
jgi:two-component system chemotaxis response regulator CheB